MSKGKWVALSAVFVWALTAAMVPVCHAGQKASGPASAPDLAKLVQQVRPAVGVIVTFGADGKTLCQGTAFFVRADGVGVTCHHVLLSAASAVVRMDDGKRFPVKGRLASDAVHDLALFKVEGRGLPIVPLGDSSAVRPGQRVVAVTAPEGLGNTVADGLVSAVRELPSGPLVQVTVPLSPGSSGGPIFDLSGHAVAVAAAVLTEGQALNFAIPINAVKPLLAEPGRLTPLASAREDGAYGLWLQGEDASLDGRYQEAVEHLRAALVLDPSLYYTRCCLGISYNGLGRYQEAVEAFKEVVRLKPDYATVRYNLGVVYSKLGRFEDAVASYKEAIRLKPDFAKAHCNLGGAYLTLKRWQEAVEAFKEAIRVKPDLAEAHYDMGVAYGCLGRFEDAVASYKEAIRLKPDYAKAHFGIGMAYGCLGRFDEDAVASYKEAIRLKPDFAKAHFGIGMAYWALGDGAAALEEYRILKDLDADLARELFEILYP